MREIRDKEANKKFNEYLERMQHRWRRIVAPKNTDQYVLLMYQYIALEYTD